NDDVVSYVNVPAQFKSQVEDAEEGLKKGLYKKLPATEVQRDGGSDAAQTGGYLIGNGNVVNYVSIPAQFKSQAEDAEEGLKRGLYKKEKGGGR
ncbi:hypothetical protein CRG98_046929, partial [Punica granatum]